MAKLFRSFRIYFLILIALHGCNSENSTKAIPMMESNKIFIGNSVLKSNEKVNSVSYNKKRQSIIFSTTPTRTGQNSAFEFSFNLEDALDLKNFTTNFEITGHLLHPNNIIKNSFSGEFTAFGGWLGDLIIKNNEIHTLQGIQNPYLELNLKSTITSLEFQNHLIAIGDEKGNLIFYDLNQKKQLKSLKLFDGKITSIVSYKDSQFFISGNNKNIYLVDGFSGKIIKKVSTRTALEEFLIFSGLNHCPVDQINKILYIPSKRILITSHGWDYCSKPQIKFWNIDSWKIKYQINKLDSPVYQMVWNSKSQEVVLADGKTTLRTINLSDFSLGKKILLSRSFDLYEKNKLVGYNYPFSTINSLDTIPKTDIILMGFGSFYRGGSGLLVARLNKSAIKALFLLVLDRGFMYVLTPK
jgi:hypothetical protein